MPKYLHISIENDKFFGVNLKICRVSISPFEAITIFKCDYDLIFKEIGCQQITPSYLELPTKSEVAEDNGHDCSDSGVS